MNTATGTMMAPAITGNCHAPVAAIIVRLRVITASAAALARAGITPC